MELIDQPSGRFACRRNAVSSKGMGRTECAMTFDYAALWAELQGLDTNDRKTIVAALASLREHCKGLLQRLGVK